MRCVDQQKSVSAICLFCSPPHTGTIGSSIGSLPAPSAMNYDDVSYWNARYALAGEKPFDWYERWQIVNICSCHAPLDLDSVELLPVSVNPRWSPQVSDARSAAAASLAVHRIHASIAHSSYGLWMLRFIAPTTFCILELICTQL